MIKTYFIIIKLVLHWKLRKRGTIWSLRFPVFTGYMMREEFYSLLIMFSKVMYHNKVTSYHFFRNFKHNMKLKYLPSYSSARNYCALWHSSKSYFLMEIQNFSYWNVFQLFQNFMLEFIRVLRKERTVNSISIAETRIPIPLSFILRRTRVIILPLVCP